MAYPTWLTTLVKSISFFAPFTATFLLCRVAKRSFVFLAALAIFCFVLFGPLALPGFFLGVGAAALEREMRREREKQAPTATAKPAKRKR
ncbi:MAG: hypothetical protein QW343_03160 [Candidatus Norongarragalinales archaeon]